MVPDQITTPVNLGQFFIAQVHLAQLWEKKEVESLEWFLASLRGELPTPKKALIKNYSTKHIFIASKEQYLAALEALTFTRMGQI